MSQLVNTVDSTMSYGPIREAPVLNLQSIHAQGFSDTTEVLEVRSDTTQIIRAPEATIPITKLLTLTLVRFLWKSIKPREVLSLKPGEIRKISDNLLVEKTNDGRIVLYEVIE